MTMKINPKGISQAGKNGAPPKTRVTGSGVNVKTAVNVPGGTPSRTGSKASEGVTKKPSKGRRNVPGNESTLSKGKINIKPKSTGSFPRVRGKGTGK